MVVAVIAQPGWAQAPVPPAGPLPPVPPSLPSQGDISRARVGLPPPDQSAFDLRIQTPDKAPLPTAVDAISFTVARFSVEGATAFPAAQVDAIFAPLAGKVIGLQAVRDAAARLEDLYRRNGYFLSRVFVPPQQLKDGTLTIRVVEGYIGELFVEGMDESAQATVRALLQPLLERKPIDLASIERRLLILNDLPGLSGTSVLRQGSQVGASTLVVTLEQPANQYQLTVGNAESRLLGPWSYAANAGLVRPLGLPGALSIGASVSGRDLRGAQTASARYSTHLGSDGLIVSVGAIGARARPAGSLSVLDIRNGLFSASARARYPLVRSRNDSLFLEGGLSVNHSTTRILGVKLVDDRTSVVDVGLIYQKNNWMNGSSSVTVDLYHGLSIFGASDGSATLPSVADFDPNFTRLTYGVQRLQQFPANFSALLAVQGQYTRSKLLSGELVSFGGSSIGRGYDPSAIAGDRGIGGIAEVRYDVAVGKPMLQTIQLYGFFDGARATSLASLAGPQVDQRIRSFGGGARLYHSHGVIDVQIANARRKLGGADARHNPRLLVTGSLLF